MSVTKQLPYTHGFRRTHGSSVKHGPQASPDAKRRPTDDGETDVVGRADPTRQADEAARDGVADPDAEPRLPPRQAADDHGRRDHPCVDVERVGDPEGDKVPGTPLAALGLDRLQIVVRQLIRAAGQQLESGTTRYANTVARHGVQARFRTIISALVRPGSASTASLPARRLKVLVFSAMIGVEAVGSGEVLKEERNWRDLAVLCFGDPLPALP